MTEFPCAVEGCTGTVLSRYPLLVCNICGAVYNHSTGGEATRMSSMLDELHIEAWDLLVICDGSGCGWEGPVGWCAILVDRESGRREMLSGGASNGTVNAAELQPFVYALRYYESQIRTVRDRPLLVHFISDSELTVNCGAGSFRKKANADLWASLAYFEGLGYSIFWHWTARDRNPFQILADKIAGMSRSAFKDLRQEIPFFRGDRNQLYGLGAERQEEK